jgi:hypothetical protein
MSKIVDRARQLQANGYTHMASVVKSHYKTTYYHVVPITEVLAAGRWIPAEYGQLPSGAYCRLGIAGNRIDWSVTGRK